MAAGRKRVEIGTENIPGIVGLAKAFELTQTDLVKENTRLLKLQNYLTEQIIKLIPNVLLNGADNNKLKVNKLPNNINFTFVKVEGRR